MQPSCQTETVLPTHVGTPVLCYCPHVVLLHSNLSIACRADTCSLQGSDTSAVVIKAGPSIMQGLLATLLAVSAVSRVHKVCSIFLELTGIQQTGRQTTVDAIMNWLRSAIQQLPRGESCKPYLGYALLFNTQPAQLSCTSMCLQLLLTDLCDNVGVVDTTEETSFLAECCTLLRAVANGRDEATAAGNRPDASVVHNFVASRNLKKHLRAFAERHQLDTA